MTLTRNFRYFFALVLLLSGCISQEEIARDFENNRQASFAVLSQTTPDKTSTGLEVISGGLTIADCLELALAHNKDVQRAKLRLLEAKGQMTEAVSTALPQASFNGSALRNDNTGFDTQKETYELQLLVKQPLYLGGLMGAAVDAAAVFTYQVQQELRQAIQAVQLQVQQAYLAALLAEQQVQVSEQARRSTQEHLSDTNKKVKFGVGTRFDVLRAEVRLNAVEAELIQRRNQLRLAVSNLLNVMGISQLSEPELTDDLVYEKINVAAERCLYEAIRHRPDLLTGESMIRLARDNIKAEQAGNRPKVYLKGMYQRNYPGFGANFGKFAAPSGSTSDQGAAGSISGGKEWERTMHGGVTVEWTFFDGFKTDGKVMQAKAFLREQQVLLKKLEQQAQFEVTQALLNLDSSDRFVQSQLGNVANAEEALRLAQVSFREGTGTSLDVISSELALAQARSDYNTAVHDYQLAKLNLSAAIGTIGEAPIPPETDKSEPKKITETEEPQE